MTLGNDFHRKLEKETGIKIDEESIDLPEEQTATDSFADYVRLLFEEGYLSEDDLPIESGWTRYLLNTEPIHTGGTEMTRPKEVLPGIFLERNYNKQDIKRKMRFLHRLVKDKSK